MKDYLLAEFQQSNSINPVKKPFEDDRQRAIIDFVFSLHQLQKCRQLIESRSFEAGGDTVPVSSQHHVVKSATIDRDEIASLQQLAQHMHGKVVAPAIRSLLHYTFVNSRLLTSVNSISLYKLFQILVDLELDSLMASREPHHFTMGSKLCLSKLIGGRKQSMLILLTLFECSLFNKQVGKEIKSGAIMEQRQLLYDYFARNEELIYQLIAEASDSRQHELEVKIRFVYAMMYCAFEIKNDMMESVKLHSKLQVLLKAHWAATKDELSVLLVHISGDYILDKRRMAEFGDLKIKQAKIFKDFDSGLLRLKQQEH